MSDARWLDVEKNIASSVRHFKAALALYAGGGFDEPDLDGYRASMAIMHSMLAGHTSAEAAMKRILDILGEEHPTGNDWHEFLIVRLANPGSVSLPRPPALPPEVAEALQETRRFRHRAAHTYDSFDPEKFLPSYAATVLLVERLASAIAEFRTLVDPD